MAISTRKIFVSALALLLPVGAQSSNTNNFGPISSVYVGNNGAVWFTVTTSTRSAKPSCATSGDRWTIDASTMAGQAELSMLMSAWLSHKAIWVNGTGTCTILSDTEAVSYFNVQD